MSKDDGLPPREERGKTKRKPRIADEITKVIKQEHEKTQHDIRRIIGGLEDVQKEKRLADEYVLLGAVTTFFAMITIFLFSGHDVFDIIIETHGLPDDSFPLKSTYFIFGIIEGVATVICAVGILALYLRRDIRVSKYFFFTSLIIGLVGLLIFIFSSLERFI